MFIFLINLKYSPGYIKTNFKAAGLPDNKKHTKVVPITPLKRGGEPIDIAKGVAFLASSDASFITGANLVIDGGLVYTIGGVIT